jgi:hypothetical protein
MKALKNRREDQVDFRFGQMVAQTDSTACPQNKVLDFCFDQTDGGALTGRKWHEEWRPFHLSVN